MKRPLYQHIVSRIVAMENCRKPPVNSEWLVKHGEVLAALVKNHMPSGSGIDMGTSIDTATSNEKRLVFSTAFHHMDEAGGYDGWTDHMVHVTPSLLSGIDLRITGRNRNFIKDYLHEVYYAALTTEIDDKGGEK